MVPDLYQHLTSHALYLGPYHSEHTASRPICAVNHCRAESVVRWGTTREYSGAPGLSSSFALFAATFPHLWHLWQPKAPPKTVRNRPKPPDDRPLDPLCQPQASPWVPALPVLMCLPAGLKCRSSVIRSDSLRHRATAVSRRSGAGDPSIFALIDLPPLT